MSFNIVMVMSNKTYDFRHTFSDSQILLPKNQHNDLLQQQHKDGNSRLTVKCLAT